MDAYPVPHAAPFTLAAAVRPDKPEGVLSAVAALRSSSDRHWLLGSYKLVADRLLARRAAKLKPAPKSAALMPAKQRGEVASPEALKEGRPGVSLPTDSGITPTRTGPRRCNRAPAPRSRPRSPQQPGRVLTTTQPNAYCKPTNSHPGCTIEVDGRGFGLKPPLEMPLKTRPLLGRYPIKPPLQRVRRTLVDRLN